MVFAIDASIETSSKLVANTLSQKGFRLAFYISNGFMPSELAVTFGDSKTAATGTTAPIATYMPQSNMDQRL